MCSTTQEQMFYKASSDIAKINDAFLEHVKDGLTREELAKNIERRPEIWQRFEGWLQKLPSSRKT